MLTMFSIILLVCCTVVLSVFSTEPAINLHLCKADNDVCVTNAVKAAYLLILQPNENIGAKDMDPMFQENIEGKFPDVQFNLFNTTITGYKSCEVQIAKFLNKNGNVLHIDLLCPELIMTGIYDIKGQVINNLVQGNGDFIVNSHQYKILLDLELKTLVKNGKSYNTIKSFKVKGEPLGKIHFDFSNLFNGQKDLAEQFLKFANENYKEVAVLLQDPVFPPIITKIVKNVNKYLKTISIDQYQPQ